MEKVNIAKSSRGVLLIFRIAVGRLLLLQGNKNIAHHQGSGLKSAIMLTAYRKRHATESIAYVSVEGISKLQGLHTVSPRHALFTILLRPVPGAHGPSGRLPAATRCTNGLLLSRAPVRLFMSILEERNVTTTDFDCECPD